MRLDEFLRLVEKPPAGPRPFFSAAHVIRCLQLIAGGPVSRSNLAQHLEIGEGSVRTILKMLRELNLVEIVRAGVRMTEQGRELLQQIESVLTSGLPVPAGRATVDLYNVAVVARGAGRKVSSGVEQRDAALVVGSSGASTFVYRNGRLVFPGMGTDMETLDPDGSERIKSALKIREGDALIIGSAGNLDRAYIGAIAAALTIIA